MNFNFVENFVGLRVYPTDAVLAMNNSGLNNTKNLSNSFHGETSLKDTIFSVQKALNGYIFSVWYKLIHFSLPLNPVIHRMGNAAKILCPSPDVEIKKGLNPILYFIANPPKLLQTSSSELINLNYSFNIPFKINLKATKELLLNSKMVYI